MQKLTPKLAFTCCALPLLLLFASAASAAESAPVDLVGSEEIEKSGASPVDNALKETMEAPAEIDPVSKPSKSGHAKRKSDGASSYENAGIKAPANDKTYSIQAGDVLQITVWKESDMDREVLVLPDGTVSFPLIGSFMAEGLTPAQVQATIKKKLATLIPDASVTVLVKATLGHSISVIGQVTKPGELLMGHPLTVMQALSQAGGLTPFASEGNIKILRKVDGKETAIKFPYDDIANGENLEKNIMLMPGDVVVVPTASLF